MLYHTPPAVGRPARGSSGGARATLAAGIVVLPGFSLLSLAALVDVFRLATDGDGHKGQPRCSWTIMGPVLEAVQSSAGIELTPWERLGDPTRFDYVIVVGGAVGSTTAAPDIMIDYLRQCASTGVRLVGVGGGVMALTQAGLLRQRRCCVHWSSFGDFLSGVDDARPIGHQLYVDDGNRITCAGEFSTADLAVWLVERHCGRAAAQLSVNLTLLGAARPGNAAQPHPVVNSGVEHDRVRRAIILMEQNLNEPFQVCEIARRVHVSKRQLERLFQHELGMSVQAFSRRLRLRYGLWKLISTTTTVTDIAQECGFSDSSHFCRKFAQLFGQSPTEARARPEQSRELYTRISEAVRAGQPVNDERPGPLRLVASA